GRRRAPEDGFSCSVSSPLLVLAGARDEWVQLAVARRVGGPDPAGYPAEVRAGVALAVPVPPALAHGAGRAGRLGVPDHFRHLPQPRAEQLVLAAAHLLRQTLPARPPGEFLHLVVRPAHGPAH